MLRLGRNGGFARAANAGVAAVDAPVVALVNTDVVLAPHWLEFAAGALGEGDAAVATKMADLDDPTVLYSTGDILRRDGVCEQRGRFETDKGFYDEPGEVFSACAGAALYRRAALEAVGGFDERLGMYLEDVELGLRLQLAGWRCAYEPNAYSRHAGAGSSGGPGPLIERNTLLLVARYFRLRWLPQVAYRQAAWAWHAARERRLREHLAACGWRCRCCRSSCVSAGARAVPIDESFRRGRSAGRGPADTRHGTPSASSPPPRARRPAPSSAAASRAPASPPPPARPAPAWTAHPAPRPSSRS